MSHTESLTDEQIDSYLAGLDDTGRTVVAYFIDGEIQAQGTPSTRPGSKIFNAAQERALSNIINRELDLSELAPDIIASIEAEGDNDEQRATQKATRKRIEGIAEYLKP